MAENILYFFPDTNLFIQCRPLEELDWSAWSEFEEIHLMVCRPVQREIDDQKNRGNGRVAQRARTTYSLFRNIIDSQQDYHLINSSEPAVKLYLEGPSLPSQDLNGFLDYSKSDDELVGCLYRFQQENKVADVRLLTHDGGPMMTAKSLGLPFVPIKEDWLLPPENNEQQREIARLNREIDQLKKLEPNFLIRCRDDKEREVSELEVECRVYAPLDDGDIRELTELLKERFPISTNFGDASRPNRPATIRISDIRSDSLLGSHNSARSPSDKEIANYRDREYPNWVETCRRVFSNLHKALQRKVGQPRVRFTIVNGGTRPGRDTLVEFTARGNFKLAPPQEEFPDWHGEEEGTSLRIPPPPKPPRGMSIMDYVANLTRTFDYPVSLPSSHLEFQRDPNEFYYKPDFPIEPTDSLNLACDQWRHGMGEENFIVEICADPNSSEVTGQLDCVIQAENLSAPASKGIRMKIKVIKMDTKDYAYRLISTQLG